MARIEYIKTIIHGDKELRNELLIGVLRNYLWGKRYFKGPVHLFLQHNRDIYYMLGGPEEDRAAWTDPHLDEDERRRLKRVDIQHVIDRLDSVPNWWPTLLPE